MSDARGRATLDPLILRGESNLLISAADLADRIENLVATREGTLRSVEGPAPFLYIPEQGDKGFPTIYSDQMYGVYHTLLQAGSVDLLLVHSGSNIYSFQGWKTPSGADAPFKIVVGSSGALVTQELESTDVPQFPTQFETTPKGVVIVPQNEARAVFYNGITALPLGYDSVPPAAVGHGPETSDPETAGNINADGYGVSRMAGGYTLHSDFGYGRLGTVESRSDVGLGARLFSGIYQCSYQWIDAFGNLSPIAPRSNEVRFLEQQTKEVIDAPEMTQKHVLWSNIATGPTGTLGRILSRTKDTLNSGTQKLFIVPGNVGYGVYGAFATLPDNSAIKWPDNVPDAWILAEPRDAMVVPVFKLCRLALGVLWIANTSDDPGVLIPSMPGRYGTFLQNTEIFPDPSGGEITGLWSTPSGLLVFTAASTFLLTPGADGTGFRVITLNANAGCLGPSSIASLPTGVVIWLGREGFYGFDGEGISLISEHIRRETDRINPVRAKGAVAIFDPNTNEYRCWAPLDGSRINNSCFVFDGAGWRTRRKESLQSVCVTRDHRKYGIGGGRVVRSDGTTTSGLWVLDRSVGHYPLKQTTSAVETVWISWGKSKDKRTIKTVYLALRETYTGSVKVSVYRDWRMKATPEYEDTETGTLYLEEDAAPTWGQVSWDGFSWNRRRPFWKRVDINVPACEVYKIRIESKYPFEFIGMTVDEEPKLGGWGTRIS